MKKLTILSTLVFVLVFNAHAQDKKAAFQKSYFQLGTGPSSKSGGFVDLSVHGVLNDGWMLGISYYLLAMDPKNLPSDYEPGFKSLFDPLAIPFVNMSVFGFTAGKYLPASRTIWFSTEAGIGFVLGQTMHFTKDDSPSIWDANYSNTTENKAAVGGILKADFNWAFCRIAGLGLEAHANMNAIQSTTGIEFKLIFGNLANKRSK